MRQINVKRQGTKPDPVTKKPDITPPSQVPPKGGFRRISDEVDHKLVRCLHLEHMPPRNVVLKPGKYEYTCPGCGQVTKVVARDMGSYVKMLDQFGDW